MSQTPQVRSRRTSHSSLSMRRENWNLCLPLRRKKLLRRILKTLMSVYRNSRWLWTSTNVSISTSFTNRMRRQTTTSNSSRRTTRRDTLTCNGRKCPLRSTRRWWRISKSTRWRPTLSTISCRSTTRRSCCRWGAVLIMWTSSSGRYVIEWSSWAVTSIISSRSAVSWSRKSLI